MIKDLEYLTQPKIQSELRIHSHPSNRIKAKTKNQQTKKQSIEELSSNYNFFITQKSFIITEYTIIELTIVLNNPDSETSFYTFFIKIYLSFQMLTIIDKELFFSF